MHILLSVLPCVIDTEYMLALRTSDLRYPHSVNLVWVQQFTTQLIRTLRVLRY
jgi:hypothetical protein